MGDIDSVELLTLPPINSPLEAALRTLVILCHTFPRAFDVRSLTSLDYLLVHSGDVEGPESIHPATPFRSGEILVRMDLVERGIHLLASRGLIEVEFSDAGVAFKAEDIGAVFLDALDSRYTLALRKRATWLADFISEQSLERVTQRVADGLTIWGDEFQREAIFHGATA